MSDPAAPSPGLLPRWARRDHPIVTRELAALPVFLGRRGRLRNKSLVMGLAALSFVPWSCLCGGVLWPLLLVPLSWLPLIWAAPVINREVEARTWDDLRLTPYSVREIVLAKLSAVAYRLSPLLVFVLVGQLASGALLGLGWAVFFGSTAIYVNGTVVRQPALLSGDLAALLGTLALAGSQLLLTPFASLAEFLGNIAIGGLASSLTVSRPLAYIGAFVLRLLFSVVTLALLFVAALLLTRRPEAALVLLALTGLGSSPGLLLMTPPRDVAASLAVALLLAGMQVAVLGAALGLLFWRAERL